MGNAHEAYISGRSLEQEGQSAKERDFERELMLQLSWFQHRAASLLQGGEMERALQRIAEKSSEEAGRIARAGDEAKKEIIVDDMIGSPMGSAEATWFRSHFPSDLKKPLTSEYQTLSKKFETEPDFVNTELDRLFRESVTLH